LKLATASLKNLKSRSKLKKTKGDGDSESEGSERPPAGEAAPAKGAKEKKVSSSMCLVNDSMFILIILDCLYRNLVRARRKEERAASLEGFHKTSTRLTFYGLI